MYFTGSKSFFVNDYSVFELNKTLQPLYFKMEKYFGKDLMNTLLSHNKNFFSTERFDLMYFEFSKNTKFSYPKGVKISKWITYRSQFSVLTKDVRTSRGVSMNDKHFKWFPEGHFPKVELLIKPAGNPKSLCELYEEGKRSEFMEKVASVKRKALIVVEETKRKKEEIKKIMDKSLNEQKELSEGFDATKYKFNGLVPGLTGSTRDLRTFKNVLLTRNVNKDKLYNLIKSGAANKEIYKNNRESLSTCSVKFKPSFSHDVLKSNKMLRNKDLQDKEKVMNFVDGFVPVVKDYIKAGWAKDRYEYLKCKERDLAIKFSDRDIYDLLGDFEEIEKDAPTVFGFEDELQKEVKKRLLKTQNKNKGKSKKKKKSGGGGAQKERLLDPDLIRNVVICSSSLNSKVCNSYYKLSVNTYDSKIGCALKNLGVKRSHLQSVRKGCNSIYSVRNAVITSKTNQLHRKEQMLEMMEEANEISLDKLFKEEESYDYIDEDFIRCIIMSSFFF